MDIRIDAKLETQISNREAAQTRSGAAASPARRIFFGAIIFAGGTLLGMYLADIPFRRRIPASGSILGVRLKVGLVAHKE